MPDDSTLRNMIRGDMENHYVYSYTDDSKNSPQPKYAYVAFRDFTSTRSDTCVNLTTFRNCDESETDI